MAEPEPPSPAPQHPVVEVEGLSASYGDQRVLQDVSMTVHRGEIMVILGGSGSGKSTLLKCILGIHRPDEGTVKVLGKDIGSASESEREEIYKQVGIVYQGGALFGSMTVADNVATPLREHTELAPEIIRIAVRMKLGLVKLSGFDHRLPSELSGGQAKRVAFARAIARDPKVLFCDEPSAGLDPRIARGIDDLMLTLNRAYNMAILVVTHEMESVKVIADRVTMLVPRTGGARVALSGPLEEMLTSDDPEVRDFVSRAPLQEPRTEAAEILRQLTGGDRD